MSHSHNEFRVPRPALYGALALIVLSIGAAATVRWIAPERELTEDGVVAVQVRLLQFEERADGSLAIIEADRGTVLELAAPNTEGFIRGIVRGLRYKRQMLEVDVQSPFRLTKWSNGHLTFEDPATGMRIPRIRAFGETQYATMDRLLQLKETT